MVWVNVSIEDSDKDRLDRKRFRLPQTQSQSNPARPTGASIAHRKMVNRAHLQGVVAPGRRGLLPTLCAGGAETLPPRSRARGQ